MDWVKLWCESINSTAAVWLWFKVFCYGLSAFRDWIEIFLFNLSKLASAHTWSSRLHTSSQLLQSCRFACRPPSSPIDLLVFTVWNLEVKLLCSTDTQVLFKSLTPSEKVMHKTCCPEEQKPGFFFVCVFLPSGYIFMLKQTTCVHVCTLLLVANTDLSDVKWLQSGVLLQDEELIPHPASLHPLQQCRASGAFLLRRFTQEALRQNGQNAKGQREQSAHNSWGVQSDSHREAQSRIWRDFCVPPLSLHRQLFSESRLFWLLRVFWEKGREKIK